MHVVHASSTAEALAQVLQSEKAAQMILANFSEDVCAVLLKHQQERLLALRRVRGYHLVPGFCQAVEHTARWSKLTPDEIRTLSTMSGVSSLILENITLPPEALTVFLTSPIAVRAQLAAHRNLPAEIQLALVDDELEVVVALSRNVALDPEVFVELSRSKEPEVLNGLAGNVQPQDLLSDERVGVPYWQTPQASDSYWRSRRKKGSLEEALRACSVPLEEGLALGESWQGTMGDLKEAIGLTLR